MPITSGGSNPNWPLISLMFGFGQAPNQAAPSYNTPVAYLNRSLAISPRGRQYEQGQYQSSTMTGQLDNRDGQFAPGPGLNANLLTPDVAAPGCVSGAVPFQFAAVSGATLSRDTTSKLGPNRCSLKVVIPGSLASLSQVATVGGFLVKPGVVYSFASQIVNQGPTVSALLEIQWLDITGTLISTQLGSPAVVTGTTGYCLVENKTAPVNAWTVRLAWITSGGATTGVTTWYISNIEMVAAAVSAFETVSAHYPNVRPETPVQFLATWAGTPYPVWTGFVERWPQTWNSPGFGVGNFVGVDAYAALANITLDSAYDADVLLDGPVAYYPMHEDSGSLSIANYSAVSQPDAFVSLSKLAPSAPTFGAATLLDPLGDGGTSMTGSGTAANSYGDGGCIILGSSRSGPQLNPVGGWTVEAWFESSNADDLIVILNQGTTNLFGYAISVLASNNPSIGEVLLQFNPTLSAPHGWFTTVALNRPHHLVVTLGSDGMTNTVYLDGVQLGSPYVLGSPISFSGAQLTVLSSAGLTGSAAGSAPMSETLPTTSRISNLALYDYPLSATQVGNHYLVGSSSAAGEGTDARHARILSYAGWSGPQTAFGCASQAGPLICKGALATDALNLNALSEAGTLYIDASGTVTLAGRQYRESLLPAGAGNPEQTNPAWIIGDGPGEYHYDSAPIFDFDPTYVYDIIQSTRVGGLVATVVNTPSELDYFPRILTQTVCLATDQDNTDQAGWLGSRYAQPQQRPEVVTFSPSSDPNLWPFVLGAEIGDLVTVNRRPPGAPMVSVVGFIESIAHNITPGQDSPTWQTSVQISPLFTYYGRCAALWSTMSGTAGAGSTGLSLAPLPDAAVNPAETAFVCQAPAGVASGGGNPCPATPGTQLTVNPGGPTAETVTVTSAASFPTPLTTGYSGIVLHVTPALTYTHNLGELVCEALPAPHTAPTDWDPYAVVDDGTGTVGDLVTAY